MWIELNLQEHEPCFFDMTKKDNTEGWAHGEAPDS